MKKQTMEIWAIIGIMGTIAVIFFGSLYSIGQFWDLKQEAKLGRSAQKFVNCVAVVYSDNLTSADIRACAVVNKVYGLD